ncbi:hypothetical protein MNBD_IGNAVI01-480 [hydrothermal vent metagenome]|uniref:Uncharacterized protein n=1 Tax=hydrothermal vent metagenome TaxID=652676 RepID=A0A3B1C1X0_9ZZZZ
MAKGNSQIDFSKLTVEETLKQLNVDPKIGLTKEDV